MGPALFSSLVLCLLASAFLSAEGLPSASSPNPASGMASPASAPANQAAAPSEDSPAAVLQGVASWYGPSFDGKATSNGEIYDKSKLTCAHRSLPFGTYLLVRNLDNDSSVVVRVNDRGPFAKDRIIDLSEAAAGIIGMLPTGTARVSLEIIPKEEALAWKGGSVDGSPVAASPDASTPTAQPASAVPKASGGPVGSAGSFIRIQVASFGVESNAQATISRLTAAGLKASIENAAGKFRVVFPYLNAEDARRVSAKLDSLGYRGYMVTTVSSM